MTDAHSPTIVDRLLKSFTDLERAIEGARGTLTANPTVPENVIKRLDSYNEILERQRNLAAELQLLVEAGDYAEVARHISLINALSGMIIEDAKMLLGMFASGQEPTEDDLKFC